MQNGHVRAALATGVVIVFGAGVQAQAPLTFEVASVKPTAPGQRGGIIRQMPGGQRYVGTNVPLRLLMTVAYSVTDRQISGGPAWVAADNFDIDAKAARPGTSEDLHVMLQHLLEDRFHLQVKHEKREQAVYELAIDKGAKMPVHDPEDKDYPPFGGARGGVKGTNVTMNYFAFFLSRILDRTVIDKTGLAARYDVNLQFTPEQRLKEGGGDAPPVEAEGPSIFTAVREQLGLKLVGAKGPVEYLVIEHVERPAEN
jgi:uncharacterized protein (TIGR03435 family)